MMVDTTATPYSSNVKPRARGRNRTIVVGVLAVAVAVGLAAPTFVGSWAPLAHWTCQDQALVAHETDRWIPTVLVNSPYLGSASGNGSMNWTFPGAWNGPPPPSGHILRTGWGTSAKNGTAAAALFTANASLYQLGNETQWGPGANVRCTQPFAVAFQSPTIYAATTARIHTQSNLSDVGEADNASAYASPSNVSRVAFINNSFSQANSQNISTCGAPALTRPFQSDFLTVDIPFTIDGQTIALPYVLPFTESFNYTFPANGGVWQVDNLAIGPGAPGGGWAFSYSPCT